MIQKLTFALALLLLSCTHLYAQSNKFGAELSEIRKNKNQIDVDIKNIFTGLNRATLVYKRAFQAGDLVDVNAIKLIRFSGSFNNQITFTEDPTRLPDNNIVVELHPSNILDVQVGIGFEKQKMNKDFVHYFGIDGIINYTKSDDDLPNGTLGGVINNATSTTDRLISNTRAGIVPFFGIKYYFTNRLSLGIETGLAILYFNQSITEVIVEANLVNGQIVTTFEEDDPVKSSGIQTNFNGLRFLSIGYTF